MKAKLLKALLKVAKLIGEHAAYDSLKEGFERVLKTLPDELVSKIEHPAMSIVLVVALVLGALYRRYRHALHQTHSPAASASRLVLDHVPQATVNGLVVIAAQNKRLDIRNSIHGVKARITFVHGVETVLVDEFESSVVPECCACETTESKIELEMGHRALLMLFAFDGLHYRTVTRGGKGTVLEFGEQTMKVEFMSDGPLDRDEKTFHMKLLPHGDVQFG